MRAHHQQRQMIKLGTEASIAASVTRCQQCHGEAESPQQGGKKAIQLIADAAAPPRDDLIKQCRFVEHDRTSEVNIEVFKWYRVEVRAVEGAQRGAARFERPLIVDVL